MKKYIETNFRQKSFEKENNCYRFCMNSLIPFITIRNKGEFSKIHWDYFSYPDESFDKLLFSLEEEIKKNMLDIFFRYANDKSKYAISAGVITFYKIESEKAPYAASDMFDLIHDITKRINS